MKISAKRKELSDGEAGNSPPPCNHNTFFSGNWQAGMQCVDLSRLVIAHTPPCMLLLGKTRREEEVTGDDGKMK